MKYRMQRLLVPLAWVGFALALLALLLRAPNASVLAGPSADSPLPQPDRQAACYIPIAPVGR